MGKRAFALAAFVVLLFAAVGPAAADCQCRYAGKLFEQGALVCIRIGQEARLARCEMLLNNSSWTFLQPGCPTALMSPVPAAPHGRKS